MIEALDKWIIYSEFVKNPPDYNLLPDPYTITFIDGNILHKAIELAKQDKSINIEIKTLNNKVLLKSLRYSN